MTKAIVKMDCKEPGCKHIHDVEIDLPEPVAIAGSISTTPTLNAIAPSPSIEPKIEETKDPHEEMTKALPSGVNFAKCEGADCGHVKLKNPKQTTNHKACPNCKNNNVPKNSDFCPNCGIEEESKKFEEWEDSDIEIEEKEND